MSKLTGRAKSTAQRESGTGRRVALIRFAWAPLAVASAVWLVYRVGPRTPGNWTALDWTYLGLCGVVTYAILQGILSGVGSKPDAHLRIGSWVAFKGEARVLYFALAVVSLGLVGYLQVQELRYGKAIISDPRPTNLTADEWNLQLGMNAYRARMYELALEHFTNVTKLSGNDFVRWKLFEALSKLRLLENTKFARATEPDPRTVDEVVNSLSLLHKEHSDSLYYPTVQYWLGQTLLQFKNDPGRAEVLFTSTIQGTDRQWKQGAMYYSSQILFSRGGDENLAAAVLLLEQLVRDHPNDLVRIVERGDDFLVRTVVPGRLAELRSRTATSPGLQ